MGAQLQWFLGCVRETEPDGRLQIENMVPESRPDLSKWCFARDTELEATEPYQILDIDIRGEWGNSESEVPVFVFTKKKDVLKAFDAFKY